MSIVAGVLMIAGAAFAVVAAIGVLRFGDTYSRMHAASKGPTLALLLVVIGAAIELADARAVLLLVLALGLQLLTTPVGSHMLGRSVHRDAPVEGVDELARDLESTDDHGHTQSSSSRFSAGDAEHRDRDEDRGAP